MTDRTFNEELLDAMIRHSIGIQQFSGSLRKRVWALLDATELDLKRQIKEAGALGFESPARVARLAALLKRLREIRGKAWSEVREMFTKEMRSFAVAEAGFLDRTIAAAAPVVRLGTVLPQPATLRRIVSDLPFVGKTLKEHLAHLQGQDVNRIEGAIKTGLVQGESRAQISRRIVGSASLRGTNGVTQVTRRQAASIVRTVTNGVGAESRRAFAEENKDLAPKQLFTATLDSRTTPICRRFDGQQFEVGEGPVLPLHIEERSVYTLVLDGEVLGTRPIRNFTQKQLVREFGEQEGIKVKVPRGETLSSGRDAIPRGHKGAYDAFARKRMRELTGTVPAKTTYTDFLTRQSAAVQDDILGKTRGILFRRGGLPLSKFVEYDGTEITLETLARRNAAEFRKAGLDPAVFAA